MGPKCPYTRATLTAGKLRSCRVGHINGLMFAPALLMLFLKRHIGLYAVVVDIGDAAALATIK